MRAVIQRVKHATVEVDQKTVGMIHHGLLVYLGIGVNDTLDMIPKMAEKLLNLRVFEDQAGKMNLSVEDHKGSLMIISQFTLYGNATKGNRPSFTEAMPLKDAEDLYQSMLKYLGDKIHVAHGVFGAHMTIHQVNDGPVTIIYEI
ncbi:MAG: D-aminoacyl-tRNA deacylase [Acholeplasmataceae bacterium]